MIDADIITKIESRLKDRELTPKHRAFIEKSLAKETYIREGRLMSISDEQGNQSIFNPSEKDISYKKTYDNTKILINKKAAKRGVILWASILLLSIAIGLLSPIRNKKN